MGLVKYCLTFLMASTMFPYVQGQPLNAFEEEFIKIIQNARPCVVKIKVTYKHKCNPRSSSGIILDQEGHIATVASAIKGGSDICVHLDSGQRLKGKLIGIDIETNLAVLKVDFPQLKPVDRGFSDELRVGAFLVTIGNPYGLSNSVSTGIVSGLKRCVYMRGCSRPITGLIQTTAPINPGDDGGLVVDSRGKFVGMAFSTLQRDVLSSANHEFFLKFFQFLKEMQKNSTLSPEHRNKADFLFKYYPFDHHQHLTAGSGNAFVSQGINFVLPSKRIYWVVSQIIKKGALKRGWLGISVTETDSGRGLLVTQVLPQSPAEKNQIQPGDILISIHGNENSDSYTLLDQISYFLAEETPSLKFIRKDKELLKTIPLAEMPPEPKNK